MNSPASSMMPTLQMEGNADSGFGVRVAGFYSAVAEWGKKSSELITQLPNSSGLAHCETNGYTGMIIWDHEAHSTMDLIPKKLLTFRREPYQFFLGLEQFLRHHKVRRIVSASLSGSLGSLSLAMLVQTA